MEERTESTTEETTVTTELTALAARSGPEWLLIPLEKGQALIRPDDIAEAYDYTAEQAPGKAALYLRNKTRLDIAWTVAELYAALTGGA